MPRLIAGLFVLIAASVSLKAHAQDLRPRYQLDQKSTHVLQISNLSPGMGYHPAQLSGRVVKREFDDSALIVKGAVVGQPDGRRTFVNIELNLDDVSMVDRDWLVTGLQTLLAEGKQVWLGIKLCGAAGRVIMVGSIR